MKNDEAKKKGYQIVRASAIEVGLLKNGQGIRTWWLSQFGGHTLDFEHPLIQEAIEITESLRAN